MPNMAWPGAVVERRWRGRMERGGERGRGPGSKRGRGGTERERERREGRWMSRQLHSGGHQSNTKRPAGCRCLPDGQMSAAPPSVAALGAVVRTHMHPHINDNVPGLVRTGVKVGKKRRKQEAELINRLIGEKIIEKMDNPSHPEE